MFYQKCDVLCKTYIKSGKVCRSLCLTKGEGCDIMIKLSKESGSKRSEERTGVLIDSHFVYLTT